MSSLKVAVLIEAEIDLKTKGAYVASVALSFEAMGRLGNGNIYEQRGLDAVNSLSKEGCTAKFHQLDILSQESIQKLKKFLEEQYGGLDILVNNAGIAYKMSSTAPFREQAEVTLRTNFQGTLDVCHALFPLLKPHARVVNVSSMASRLSQVSEEWQKKFRSTTLTEEELVSLMDQFVR
ncbi:Carbonyl reductase [NADPH] 1 [Acropora cervicornis]|uniref:Carbonyl reductase [NADPH] 1 n=1 Tax=Acropora cervicornis TaxID=6130 RepID=A0AAD9QNS6_ACRCE|nr:Carbonyl reductase [NADPH] 1 [Acropora cervicornis]